MLVHSGPAVMPRLEPLAQKTCPIPVKIPSTVTATPPTLTSSPNAKDRSAADEEVVAPARPSAFAPTIVPAVPRDVLVEVGEAAGSLNVEMRTGFVGPKEVGLRLVVAPWVVEVVATIKRETVFLFVNWFRRAESESESE